MKHVFYVIYVLFYTGAVFVTGLFVGQLLERSWAVRRGAAQLPSSTEASNAARGVAGQQEATASVSKRN